MKKLSKTKAKSILKKWNTNIQTDTHTIKDAIETKDFVFIAHEQLGDFFSIFKRSEIDGEYEYFQDINDLNITDKEGCELNFGASITTTLDEKWLLVGATTATSFIITEEDRELENNGAVFVLKQDENGYWQYHTKIVNNAGIRFGGFGKKIKLEQPKGSQEHSLIIAGNDSYERKCSYVLRDESFEDIIYRHKIQEEVLKLYPAVPLFNDNDFAFFIDDDVTNCLSSNKKFFLIMDKHDGHLTPADTLYRFELRQDDITISDTFLFDKNYDIYNLSNMGISNNGKYFFIYEECDDSFEISVFSTITGYCKRILHIKEIDYIAPNDFFENIFFTENTLVIKNFLNKTWTFDIEQYHVKLDVDHVKLDIEYTVEGLDEVLNPKTKSQKKKQMTEAEMFKAMTVKESKDKSRAAAIKKGIARAEAVDKAKKSLEDLSVSPKNKTFKDIVTEGVLAKPVLKKIDTRTILDDPKIKPKSSDFQDACIRSGSDIIYEQLFQILCNEYTEYKELFANPIMRGFLFNLFSMSLQQIEDFWKIDNDSFRAIIHQTKISGIAAIMNGGFEFGKSFIEQIAVQVKSHLNLEYITKAKQNVGT